MSRLSLLFAGVFAFACNVGSPPKDPTTPDPDWPVVDPDTDPVFAAAGGSSCPNAIENTKRLGCGFEAADPAKWCATLTTKQVSCMSDPKIKSCLAMRQCTEPTK
jgi:hypothetical protein